MLENQAQNLASQRAMTGAWIGAAGNVASSAISAGAGGMGGGGGGLNSAGFYGGAEKASSAYNVPTSQLSYQPSTGLGGFAGLGKQGGYYYTPAGSFGR
jgi:hypothetical protein